MWLLVPYLGFAARPVVGFVQHFYRRRVSRALLLFGALLVPYVLVAAPNAQHSLGVFANGLLAMAAYVFIPGTLAIYRQKSTKPRPLDLADVLVLLMVWLPLEFGWLPAAGVVVVGVSVSLTQLTGVMLLLLVFTVIRPLGQIGYTFSLTQRDLTVVGKATLVFLAVGVPLGLLAGFIAWRPPQAFFIDALLLRFAAIFLLVGLPEELFFRGVLQNLVERRFGERHAALIIAAFLFGAAQLNNSPAPHYTSALFATAAGIAYGWVWMRTRAATAAALTHTLVNWVWAVFLGGGFGL